MRQLKKNLQTSKTDASKQQGRRKFSLHLHLRPVCCYDVTSRNYFRLLAARRESLERSIFFCQENHKKSSRDKKRGEVLNNFFWVFYFHRRRFNLRPLPAATLDFLPTCRMQLGWRQAESFRLLRHNGNCANQRLFVVMTAIFCFSIL